VSAGLGRRFEPWACYHTELDTFALAGRRFMPLRPTIMACTMAANVWEWYEDYFSPRYHHIARSLARRTVVQPVAARRLVPLPRILLQPLSRRGPEFKYAGQLFEQHRVSRCPKTSRSFLIGVLRTGLNLNRHMTESAQATKPSLVGRRRQRIVRDYRDHRGTVARTDLP
jgi:hypothetical protein